MEKKLRRFKTEIKDDQIKSKKFVFQIDPENIDFVDSLSYENKNILINQLITNYKEGVYTAKTPASGTTILKYAIIIFLISVVAVPLFIYLVNISMHATDKNYKLYQGGFEKLFKTSY